MATALVTATGIAVGATLVLPDQVAAATKPVSYRAPVATYTIANPGSFYTGKTWVVLSTGSWSRAGAISTAPTASGPFRTTRKPLLNAQPAWSSRTDHSYWAPSMTRASDGHYVVFFAAVVKGQRAARCIGSAYGDSPWGGFTPNHDPVACWTGSGTHGSDLIRSEGAGFSLIDPTPATIDGRLYLTYKTQIKRGDWHTTIRLVRLDPAHPGRAIAASRRLTSWRSPSIEENPVLIKRDGVYTLFTSRGWYGRCDGPYAYHTVYRQSRSLAHFPDRPTTLSFPKGTNTCGLGNAMITPTRQGTGWLIWWNGHVAGDKTPFRLYTASLDWAGGTPSVGAIKSRATHAPRHPAEHQAKQQSKHDNKSKQSKQSKQADEKKQHAPTQVLLPPPPPPPPPAQPPAHKHHKKGASGNLIVS